MMENKSVLNETIIVVQKSDGNKIIRTFGKKIFNKSERIKLLKNLFTAQESIEYVIIGQVDNMVDTYYLEADGVRPERNPNQSLNDLMIPTNYWNILESIKNDVTTILKDSGLFDFEFEFEPTIEIDEDHNIEVNISSDDITEDVINEICDTINLRYVCKSTHTYGNTWQIIIQIPSLVHGDNLVARL